MKLFLIAIIIFLITTNNAMCITKMDISVNIIFNEKQLVGEAKIYDYEKTPELSLYGIEITDRENKIINNKELTILRFKKDIKEELNLTKNIISDNFLALYDNWFPKLREYSIYNLKVIVDEGYIPVSEADDIIKKDREFNFIFNYPRRDVSLIVGKFSINREVYKDLEILTYFLRPDNELSNTYIRQIRFYLDKYSEILGKFPFKRFAVVENPLQTGYGFPTYTLLGSAVIRLPFIPHTSLGHEFVHNWFGNSIYNDFSKGNWVEGLTTYFSDYLYEKEKNNEIEYRKNVISKYMSYNPNEDYILKEFRANTDRRWESVGYGKGFYLFYTLENYIGQREFNNVIREFIRTFSFREANWDDLQEIFQKNTEKKIEHIFEQFLMGKEIPNVDISDISIETDEKGEFLLKFNISQKNNKPYHLSIPVEVETTTDKKDYEIQITEKNTNVTLKTYDLPVRLIIDPQYKLMRRLSHKEYPPILHRIFGANNGIIVINTSQKELYSEVIDFLKNTNPNYNLVEWNSEKKFVWDTYKNTNSIIFLGNLPANISKIIDDTGIIRKGIILTIKNNITDNSLITHIKIDNKEEFKKIARRIWHFGQYTRLIFSDGNIIEKNIEKTQKGIIYELINNINILTKDNVKNFTTMLNDIKNKEAILIGEQHDRYEHHIAQLIIIKALHKKGYNIAVGMEMFQEPFQAFIDKYLINEISETDFLIQTEYFKRWGFDYKLYKPIIDYCKSNNIKIIALNTPTELTKKISQSGLDSLNPSELEKIPFIDIHNDEYRDFLREFFIKSHKFDAKQDFLNFYLAQLLWDETMAENSFNFLKKNPYHKIIILAGNGHIDYYYGIPNRLVRRGINNIATISNFHQGVLDLNKADYIMVMPPFETPFTPRLGVTLEETERGLLIKDLEKNSIADKSGLRKNDIILIMDGIKTDTVDTLKALLSTKKLNDTVKLKIIRKTDEKKGDYIETEVETVPFFKNSPHQFFHPR